MNAKIERIETMLGRGWDVEDIVSDERTVSVLLQREASRATVVLDSQDAWEVLCGDGLRPGPEDVLLPSLTR